MCRETLDWLGQIDSAKNPEIDRQSYRTYDLGLADRLTSRGFSFHRIIKDRLRNRLRVVTIDSLMRVRLLAQPFEVMDFSDASDVYASGTEPSTLKTLMGVSCTTVPCLDSDVESDEEPADEGEDDEEEASEAFMSDGDPELSSESGSEVADEGDEEEDEEMFLSSPTVSKGLLEELGL
ncbi:hypothetical protein VOLCADRAFT_97512 [Volvox carteri f. nagariensis]|uniref:Uncharacterized protein n=1 Tax=Volvox carteri f. nagariensis TaxID=3068 RepID=D8UCX6_VOLCA|nr:uncharacterized protein VOLCADRAFT_97512 [Volvox carteri f. nagariensis]EFJ42418.1 hypothetical protein VOLCADRAFT_97512 [Volvox carteri f. nagariensis]|eukprot:XP_002956481.1 hypothetical protein VOLCADRAFT_97512 [Volvox carteri f. nagariensis]